jgi:hypothetical protein
MLSIGDTKRRSVNDRRAILRQTARAQRNADLAFALLYQ